MIKKFSLIIITFALFGAFLYGYMVLQYKEKKINEVANIQYGDITKIVFFDGRGNNPPITLEDKQKITEFEQLLDRCKLKKEKLHDHSKEWIYRADFYKGDNQLTSITFSNLLQIDGRFYNIVEGDLSPDTIHHFLKSANLD
ncbi:hypothetical protein KHA93_19875 [Bacillus sp. FJAT-49732]|uniref:Uncharacterized protein n=1 Tax=Lederbergia citrisecunda TaxID=2833583 RepID=A0A942TS15_9BACI|nr:hypothetical protein [Lederbergia citrisecunda]MBS4201867.1 hypothetical protein [Lederbergia citrisecunda]